MTLDENRGDLERHADDFRKRTGFTYTVLDRPTGDIVGCVYIYPVRDSEHDARVLSWVRASRADLRRSVVAQRRRLDRRGVAVPQRRVRRATRLGVLHPPRDGRSGTADGPATRRNAYPLLSPRARARARRQQAVDDPALEI